MAQPRMANLYGLHDRDAHPLIPAGGWCVDAVLVTDDPPNYAAIRSDINWIIRLNHGWYPNGTIPVRSGYADYAKRCADFAKRCKGANIFIISNEPNHAQEYPHGVKIEPEDYADCFNLCYQAIKTVRPEAQVCVAAVAPWDITSGIDWLAYYGRMLNAIQACDGLAVHGYTHGADPELVWSMEKSHGWYWHFPVIYQTIKAIPAKFANLPIHVTETDQGDNAWLDRNSGWVQEAYNSIEGHNGLEDSQKILSLSLYRWRGDKYEIHNKNGVIADFRAAVQLGYESPVPSPIPEPPPDPQPAPPDPQPDTLWDPRLTVRGCELTVAEAAAGQTVWRCVSGEWFDEQQAQGRVNTYVTLLDENGQLVVGVPITWYWQSGEDAKLSEVKNDPWLGHPYSKDYAMYNVAPSYGVRIADGNPTDVLWGMGLGSIEQPDYKIHTAYSFTFQRVKAQAPEPPIPPGPGTTKYVTALAGANLRAEPNQDSAILIAVPYGEAVNVYGSVSGDDGYQWDACIYQEADGFIRDDLLSYEQPQWPPEGTEPPQPASGHLIWPVLGARITQRFGDRYEYYQEHFDAAGHNGLDFGLAAGSPIYATADGIVTMAGDDKPGYGLFVRLYHPAVRLGSLYAHCNELLVQEGDMVTQGQQIATVGSTGNSTGPHCHWELCAQDASGYVNVSYGHSKGRANPEALMWILGMPPVYQ